LIGLTGVISCGVGGLEWSLTLLTGVISCGVGGLEWSLTLLTGVISCVVAWSGPWHC